jgi:KaiC/GvpD/RAD55 family RecA-like ATPase
VAGEPFIGKTLLMVQIAAEMAVQGAAVAILANDEDRVGLAQRIGQYLGLPKDELTPEHPIVLEELGHKLSGCGPIRIYPDPEQAVTAEDVARELARMEGIFRVLVVDSVQTVRVAAHEDDDPETVAIKKAAEALKAIKKTGILVLATSEAPRGAYGSRDPSQRTRALASFAGSRKVEFLFDVAALLTGDEIDDRARLELAKNRLGHRKGTVGLHLNRGRACFLSVDLGEAETAREERTEKARAERKGARYMEVRKAIMELVMAVPVESVGVSLAAIRAKAGVTPSALPPALAVLCEEKMLEVYEGPTPPEGGKKPKFYRLSGRGPQ